MDIKRKILLSILTFIIGFSFDPSFIAGYSNIDEITSKQNKLNHLLTLQNNSLIYQPYKIKAKYNVVVTAYSSTPDQTDSTPFITATGNRVEDGIIAVNFLPFGTKVLIPEIDKTKIFTVDDRMHARKKYHVDIWFPTRQQALTFGKKLTYIEVIE